MTRPSHWIRTESQFLRHGSCFSLLSVPQAPYRDATDTSAGLPASDGESSAVVAPSRVVLIVQPPGPEQARCYRLLRELAVTLASQGIVTLRLELSGTGNSVANLATTRIADWHADILVAADALQARWPEAALFGVGVRYSTRLMLDAFAQRSDARDRPRKQLSGLIGLMPVLSGEEWVDQLQQVQTAMKAEGLQLDERDLAGQPWPVQLLAEAKGQTSLPKLDSLTYTPIFILESDSRIENKDEFIQTVIGIRSTIWSSESLPMLASAEASTAVLNALIDQPATPDGGPYPTSKPTDQGIDQPIRAQPFHLGSSQSLDLPPGQGLFGMYQPGRAACPVVVMLNSGLIDSAGPYGLYVELAAQLSQLGIASVRFDFSGKGESARKSVSGLDAVLDDYAQVSDFLRSKGHQQTILLGVCSGADDALELAHLTDNVAGLVLLDSYAPTTLAYRLHYWRARLTSATRMGAWIRRKAVTLLPGFDRASRYSSTQTATQTAPQPRAPLTPIELRRWATPDVMLGRYCEVLERQCSTLALFTGALQDDYYNHAGQLSRALDYPAGLSEIYRPHLGHLYPASNQREELFELIADWMQTTFMGATGENGGKHIA